MGPADDGDNNNLKTTTIVTPLSKIVLPLLKNDVTSVTTAKVIKLKTLQMFPHKRGGIHDYHHT